MKEIFLGLTIVGLLIGGRYLLASRESQFLSGKVISITDLLRDTNSLGRSLEIQVVDRLRDRVPWAPIVLEWEEGGTMVFQSDRLGSLEFTLEQGFEEHPAFFRVETNFNGYLRVRWK